MKKNSFSKLAFINSRIFAAFVLLTFGISLGVFSFAGQRPASKKAGGKTAATTLPPTVIQSNFNGTSLPVRDLPIAENIGEHEVEPDLPRVKPGQPLLAGFADAALQSIAAIAAAPAPIRTFEGQSSVDSGGSPAGCICTPPDTNGAVGPTQYVQTVNQVMTVYDKAGTRLSGPTKLNSFFQTLPANSRCRADNDGDPVVVYDQLADRWLVSQFAVGGGNGPTSSECIAISKTPDATGEYYIYDFSLGGFFEDYPHFGLWPDAYYMSTHEFTFLNQTPAGAFQGSAAWAFERDKMLAGQPARLVKFKLGSTSNTFFGGHLPANLDGFTLPPAGSPNYFVEVDAAGDGARPDGKPAVATLDIWKFHVDWSNPLLSTFGNNGNPTSTTTVADFARSTCGVTTPAGSVSGGGCVPQLGSAGQLADIGDRLMYRAAYRNFGDHESIVLNHTVVANAVGGTATQFGPRWYEVRDPGGSPTIFQQSTFGPTGPTDLLYRWMGSIAMDHAGDMAIGYSTSSAASFPSIAYAGRLAGDAPNTLAQGETQMFAGTGPQHNEVFVPFSPTGFGRWGDYTDMTVDPVDDCTFWYTNEYYSSTDAPDGIWHTRVGSFKFPQCTPRPVGFLRGTVTDSSTGNPIVGAGVTAGSYTVYTNSSGFYQFSPLAPGSYSVNAFETGYFPNSASNIAVTDGGVTVQNFALVRNQAVPTPTPPPPTVLQTVNPPVLNDPGTTVTTNSFALTWSPAEVTAGLTGYVIEESTDYVNPLFDNADGTNLPGQAGSAWNTGDDTGDTAGWIQNPAYHTSAPNSYEGAAPGPVPLQFDPDLTLKNNITIPASVGSARLTFYSRYFNGPDDTGNVEISTNNGATWTALKVLSDAPLPPPADTRMQNHEVDLTAYKGIPFKLRFRFDGGSSVNFVVLSVGWWIDDINVDGGTWHQIGTAAPGATSFNVINKAAGHYYYRVRGTYNGGNVTTNSNVQDIIVNPPSQFLSAKSRKVHGSAGAFDVDLPLIGPAGIEPRSGGSGGNFTIVYNFANPITNCGSVSGATGTAAIGTDGKSCVADVSGLPNAQYSTITLQGVTDGSGTFNVAASVGILAGDTTANGFVNSADISQTQGQSGQPVGTNNFREDLTVNGAINSADISFVQQQSGTGLP
jgi:hypothetical protein